MSLILIGLLLMRVLKEFPGLLIMWARGRGKWMIYRRLFIMVTFFCFWVFHLPCVFISVTFVLYLLFSGSDDVGPFFSTASLPGIDTNHVFSASSSLSGVGSSRAPCMISQPANGGLGSSRASCMISQPPNVLASAAPQAHYLAHAVLPLVNERFDANEPARSPVCGPAPLAYACTRAAPRVTVRFKVPISGFWFG